MPTTTEMPGRLIIWIARPTLGSEVVVQLSHGWYHGTLLALGDAIGGDDRFIACRAAVQDPLYPPGEPAEPKGHYDCLEWANAIWPVTRKLIEELRTSHQTYFMMKRAEVLGIEYIVGVAIRMPGARGGTVYRLDWPARHHTILHMLAQTIGDIGEHDQGFWTSNARYVSRQEAALLARAAGQTVSQRSALFSEDLW